jgi:hypothetical protein
MSVLTGISGLPLYPTKQPPGSATGRQEDLRLFLQVADQQGMRWANRVVEERHYMRRRVHQRTRPMAMLVLQGEQARTRVGCLIFNRPQCTAVKGWYCGSYRTLQAHPHDYRLTMWNIVNLARVFLFPIVSHKQSPAYVQHAASRVVATALRHVIRDYLLLFPPLYPAEPFELRECISYCDQRLFLCTLYLATNFKEVRRNEHNLITYAHPLRHLTHLERDEILEASRASAQQRKRRSAHSSEESYRQLPLFDRLLPVLTPEELGLVLPSDDEVYHFGGRIAPASEACGSLSERWRRAA